MTLQQFWELEDTSGSGSGSAIGSYGQGQRQGQVSGGSVSNGAIQVGEGRPSKKIVELSRSSMAIIPTPIERDNREYRQLKVPAPVSAPLALRTDGVVCVEWAREVTRFPGCCRQW